MPDQDDPSVQRFQLEDWKATNVDNVLEPITHKIFSEPMTQRVQIKAMPWVGESQFKVRKVSDLLTPEERGIATIPARPERDSTTKLQ